tara:strand:- start:995 stop:1249 length:255 start_codon:yes stop_codon:yes gene_type:complete
MLSLKGKSSRKTLITEAGYGLVSVVQAFVGIWISPSALRRDRVAIIRPKRYSIRAAAFRLLLLRAGQAAAGPTSVGLQCAQFQL